MAKRKKLNRLAGIIIPEELKKRAVCACCGKAIIGTYRDPVISAPTLGKGCYHFECANLVWAELKRLENENSKSVE